MSAEKNVLYQVALFQSVAQGEYYGVLTAKQLKEHGDFGMGIFEAVNGELIMDGGVVYQALSDGSVVVADDNALIPYADVTFFHADMVRDGVEFSSMEELEQILTDMVVNAGRNMFYYARVTGNFAKVIARSELKQEEPFKMLNIALRTDQRKFAYEDIPGTIVALYCPPYMGGLNAPGWHCHFISNDGQKGGHMLDAATNAQADCGPGKQSKDRAGQDGCRVELAKMCSFYLDVPDCDTFNGRDLSLDVSAAIKEAERGK